MTNDLTEQSDSTGEEPVPQGHLPFRAKVASSVSKTAAALSRAAGRGDGSVIGGWLGLKIDPDLLTHLSAGRKVALVSGTNGKTTTTRLTAAAMGVLGDVATNSLGANMPTGHTSALARAGHTPYAVLEVDEHYLNQVIRATSPHVVALLNLSRDQLDRAKEVAMMASLWRDALRDKEGGPERGPRANAEPAERFRGVQRQGGGRSSDIRVVANADDPMVVWAARQARTVIWVASGQRWHDDSWVCPECGGHIERVPGDWYCTTCDLRRPAPQWTVDDGGVVDPSGAHHPVTLQLPGRVNRANAATALAVAAQFGVSPADAAPHLTRVASIAGRYATVVRNGRTIRLLLAKNPAGWLEAFDMAEAAPTLLSINARDPDGLDTSWLYDVDFSVLQGRRVLITGDRAMDLAVRLEVNEVPFEHVTSFTRALAAVPPGRLEVIANYTAFQDIRAELDRVN